MSILMQRQQRRLRSMVCSTVQMTYVQSFPCEQSCQKLKKTKMKIIYFCRGNCQIHKQECLEVDWSYRRPSGCSCPVHIPTFDVRQCSLQQSIKINTSWLNTNSTNFSGIMWQQLLNSICMLAYIYKKKIIAYQKTLFAWFKISLLFNNYSSVFCEN